MQLLRITYNFMLVLVALALLFVSIADEKQLEIFIASLVINKIAMDDINIPGKNISAWKHTPLAHMQSINNLHTNLYKHLSQTELLVLK